MLSSSGYCYNIVAGIYCAGKGGIFRQRVKIKGKTRLKSSRKHKVFPSYSVSTNFLIARSSNEVTRFPCTLTSPYWYLVFIFSCQIHC